MATFNCLKLVYVLLLTMKVLASSDKYTEYHMEQEKICYPLGKKREPISISEYPNAAAIVKPMHTFDNWLVNTDKVCKFVFRAPKGEQLFAVIQNMSLRQNGTHCLDYIQFKRKDGQQTPQFCGKMDRRQKMSQNDISNFEEFDSEGEIETTIFISKAPLEKNEDLDLTIVYTPHKDCRKIKRNREEYRGYRNDSVCLRIGYECDGVQNCATPVCRDEENCEAMDIVSNGTGTKVTIGAVTTILLCFLIFVMGLWICRKHKKLCWSPDCAGPRTDSERFSEVIRAMAASTNQRAADSMLETAAVPSGLDKDLPPSYDSLFPEQSNPSTT